jgi:hypothetical protein
MAGRNSLSVGLWSDDNRKQIFSNDVTRKNGLLFGHGWSLPRIYEGASSNIVKYLSILGLRNETERRERSEKFRCISKEINLKKAAS